MTSTPRDTLDLATAEAMLDRATTELDAIRKILQRLGVSHHGSITCPSHVTRAMAARILEIGMNGVKYRIKTNKLNTEKHWGTVLIPMASIMENIKVDAGV